MSLQKQTPLVSKKLREACQGKRCVRCNRQDGTVCGRHNEGYRKSQYGKGGAQKCHDFALAQLCNACDDELSNDLPTKGTTDAVAHAEEWNHLCLLTLIEREREGLITVKGNR